MSQRYNNSIKRPKPQDTQLGILQIYAVCRKIQQRALVPGESTAGVRQYQSLRIHPKNLWYKEGHSWSIVVTQLKLVSMLHAYTSILTYIEENDQPADFKLCHRNPDIFGKGAEPNRIIQLNCREVQVIKQPEHGRTSTTEK